MKIGIVGSGNIGGIVSGRVLTLARSKRSRRGGAGAQGRRATSVPRAARSSTRSRARSTRLDDEPEIPSQRLRELCEELGYAGRKTIFDDYVREVRPRYQPLRTFQRTVYRPGELCQFDLWEPRAPIPVGHGQLRRGWVVTAELGYSHAIATALVFSKCCNRASDAAHSSTRPRYAQRPGTPSPWWDGGRDTSGKPNQ